MQTPLHAVLCTNCLFYCRCGSTTSCGTPWRPSLAWPTTASWEEICQRDRTRASTASPSPITPSTSAKSSSPVRPCESSGKKTGVKAYFLTSIKFLFGSILGTGLLKYWIVHHLVSITVQKGSVVLVPHKKSKNVLHLNLLNFVEFACSSPKK